MLLSQDELANTAKVDPEIADFMAKNPRPGTDYSTHWSMRNGLDKAEAAKTASLGPAPGGVSETYHDIPMRDGFASTLKIIKPTSGVPGPLFVLCFGGGFVAGSKDQLTAEGRALVQLFGAAVVCISYRRGPEYKFPYSQNDAWDSCKWIASNATGSLLSSDPTKGFILGGVSAGGSITASLSRIFQEEPLEYPLTGQWLSIPSLMDVHTVPAKYKHLYLASEQNAHGPVLSKEARDAMRRWVQWDTSSPLRFAVISKTDIAGQPRTYFQMCGMDPLRDDGLIYDEMLREAGVETKVDLYPGCPHGYWVSMPGLSISNRASVDEIVGLGWLIGKDVSRAEAAKLMGVSEA